MRSLILAFGCGLFAGVTAMLLLTNSNIVTDPAYDPASVAGDHDIEHEHPNSLAPGSDTAANCDELHTDVQRLQAGNDWLRSALDEFGSDFGDVTNLWSSLPTVQDETDERRIQLVDAGYTEAESAWLAQKEEALLIAAMRAQFHEQTNGSGIDYLTARLEARAALRSELGDYDYERYLLATGQATTIEISRITPESPAKNAGLRPGDEIINYDRQRVFNMMDLADKAAAPGLQDTVAVDIVRDGVPMQLELSRGPLGISGRQPPAY